MDNINVTVTGGTLPEKEINAYISHGKEKSRKAADVVCVVMGKTDHIDRFKAPAFGLDRYLRSLSTVDHQTASIISCKERSKISARQRHHPTCSQ